MLLLFQPCRVHGQILNRFSSNWNNATVRCMGWCAVAGDKSFVGHPFAHTWLLEKSEYRFSMI